MKALSRRLEVLQGARGGGSRAADGGGGGGGSDGGAAALRHLLDLGVEVGVLKRLDADLSAPRALRRSGPTASEGAGARHEL